MSEVPSSIRELVEWSADPERVRRVVPQIERSNPEVLAVAAEDRAMAERLVAVLAASTELGRVVVSDPLVLAVLVDPDSRPPAPSGLDGLLKWSKRELLRIASRDLTGVDALATTTAALSVMAGDVLERIHTAVAPPVPLSVIAMGKLGGGELNYRSDVDLLLVGEGQPAELVRAGRRFVQLASQCFRVDLDLRPEGRDGPLVRTLSAYQSYWDRWADAWERQALLRATPIAGDKELGEAFDRAAQEMVWGRPFTPDDLRHVRAMKARAEAEVRKSGLADREVKRGPGGIRDIEFAAQLLQLVHGPDDESLRSPNTADALAALAEGDYVDPADAERLEESYVFLRRVEHALQLDNGTQTHVVPLDREDRRRIARVLGYRGNPEGGPTELFDDDLASHRSRVRTIHERLWFRPLLEALSGAGPLSPAAAADRLAAFGFTDAERTRQAVRELTSGLTRSSRMMQQLMPLLLDWLSASPDPDLGLLGLRRQATGEKGSGRLVSVFRDSPEAARLLALLLGTSRQLGEILEANPDLVERLPYPEQLATRGRDALVEAATRGIGWRDERADQQRALHRWKHRNLLGIAARDVFDLSPVEVVGADLTSLAEASLEAALRVLQPTVPFAVVAFGRLGGAELGYASDLDVAFVYEGSGAAAAEEADRVASALVRMIGGGTPAERIWEIDVDLRPEGRNGPLARSLEGWAAYLERWVSTWERQAYLRARPVAGDLDLGGRLVDAMADAIWGVPFTDEHVREVRRMKARIEKERIGPGEDPEFHLKLGRGSLSDIEFTVQLLQLRSGVRGAATIGALSALVEEGQLPEEDADVLEEAYRFCEHTRNRAYLVVGAADSLPIRPEQATPLARSLGFTVAGLREEYRRLTRRARRVVEHHFYERH